MIAVRPLAIILKRKRNCLFVSILLLLVAMCQMFSMLTAVYVNAANKGCILCKVLQNAQGYNDKLAASSVTIHDATYMKKVVTHFDTETVTSTFHLDTVTDLEHDGIVDDQVFWSEEIEQLIPAGKLT